MMSVAPESRRAVVVLCMSGDGEDRPAVAVAATGPQPQRSDHVGAFFG